MAGESAWGVIVILLGAFAFGGYVLYQQHEDAKAPTIEQQKFCSDASSKFVKEYGIRNPDDGYTNHFNAHYGKCFVETRVTAAIGGLVMRTVQDPAEHVELATYSYSYGSKESAGIIECKAKLPGEEWKQCKTLDEWNKLVGPMMGSGILD